MQFGSIHFFTTFELHGVQHGYRVGECCCVVDSYRAKLAPASPSVASGKGVPMFQLATDRQVSYITSLQTRAGLAAGVPSSLTSAQASALIEELKALAASAAAATSTALVGEGVYRRSSDGAMFRVQTSRESGNRYAKTLLESGGWDYERGAIFTLKAEERLSVEQLAEWGLATGVCAICARLLSTAESVARGIGPVCAKRY